MSDFIPGQELSRQFYEQEVRPVLDAGYPGLRHAAALLGRGSEVLGFDDEMSRDHNWEPRVLLFLQEDDHARREPAISALLHERLPPRFHGYATDHSVHTLRSYCQQHLDLDIATEVTVQDWLTLPEQRLRMFTAGAVFHDQVGLQEVRDRLAHYPEDVWLYLLIAGWWRLHPEMNLVGRTGFVGDELGSALVGSRLVNDIMRLCFLMEKQYAPYSKWFGSAFSRLDCAPALSPVLWRTLRAETWPERENALTEAYSQLAAMHNALGITAPVETELDQMWQRPFTVLWGDYPGALATQIQDPAVRRVLEEWPTGGIDQVREVLWGPRDRARLLRLLQ